MPCLPPRGACHDLRCGALTNDFITGTVSELRCSTRKDMAKKRRRRNAKRAKKATRPRDAPRESKNYAFAVPDVGVGACRHTHTYIPAVRHNKLFPMRVQAGLLLLRWPKVQNENEKKNTKRKSNKKKPPQCPGQNLSSAVEHENSVPHAGCNCSFLPPPPSFVNDIISHIHVTLPNEPCQMC